MNVGELIEKLRKFPKGTPVMLSRDAEGNGFSALHECELAWYARDGDGYVEYEGDDSDLVALLWPR